MLEIDDDPVDPGTGDDLYGLKHGMVAIAPNVGRPSRHNWRRRLSGAGFAEVKAETPCWNGGDGLQFHISLNTVENYFAAYTPF